MSLSIDVIDSRSIPAATLHEIIDLCTEAYAEDFATAFQVLGPGVHVIARVDGRVVSHAMWVVRSLETCGRRLRTAYIEAVATRPEYQRRGFATAVLRHLAHEIRHYDLGALSPSDHRFYEPLGWELWRGPLFIRSDEALESTPDEQVMILRLDGTPADLDLDAPLSAERRAGEVW